TLQIGGPDVGPFNCRTTVASQDQPSTATIDCGASKPLNQYTIVHELGHVFLERTVGSQINHPCYSSASSTYSIITCLENPVPSATNGSLGFGDTQFIFGKRSVRYTRTQVQSILNRLGVTELDADNFGPYLIDPINNPEGPGLWLAPNDWLRSVRGWGSTAPVTGPCDGAALSTFVPNDYQQNPCEVYVWLEAALKNVTVDDPLLGDIKGTELTEAGADLFLNWVYRMNNIGGFSNINEQGNPDTIVVSDLELSVPNSFPTPRQGPGDDKFYWFNSLMVKMFNYYDW
ncbi:MAG: hypothetical protein MUF87_21585, partial [Anaerolineae bacterium]|nr:hypothetical protein [Anaerolineae bacterium]